MKFITVIVAVVAIGAGATALITQHRALVVTRDEVKGLTATVEQLNQELRAVKQDTQKVATAQAVVAPESRSISGPAPKADE